MNRLANVLLLLAMCSYLSATCFAKQVTLVFAADMPDISDPVSGRYAELKTLLDRYREQPAPVFFVFGGGSIGPSAMSAFDRGAHIIDILNSLEPDVMTVTKREFSYFEDELSLRAYEAAFPILASNVTDVRFNDTPNELINSFLIEKQGTKLGVISLLNERIIEEYLLRSLNVHDPLSTAKNLAASLRQQGADIIVLHYSYPFTFVPQLLEDNTIDIAFLSDSRVKEKYQHLETHPRALHLEENGDAIVTTLNIHSGQLDVTDKRHLTLSTLAANTAIQLQVDSYQMRLDRLLEQKIGVWKSRISTLRSEVRTKENAFANLITDSMRIYAEADIALLNGGSIRGDTEYEPNSSITRRDIATELPFRSALVSINITGQQLLDALETGLSQVEFMKGGFPHVSGLSYDIVAFNPAGNRVLNVKINGVAINPTKVYKLATTDYLADGGDGYESLTLNNARESREELDILIADLVVQRIRLLGNVSAVKEQRVTFLAGNE